MTRRNLVGEESGCTWSAVTMSAVLGGIGDIGGGGHAGGRIGIDERLDDVIEVTIENLIEVVGLEVHPMVGDAVLREVISTDAFRPVDGTDLNTPLGARGRRRFFLSQHE